MAAVLPSFAGPEACFFDDVPYFRSGGGLYTTARATAIKGESALSLAGSNLSCDLFRGGAGFASFVTPMGLFTDSFGDIAVVFRLSGVAAPPETPSPTPFATVTPVPTDTPVPDTPTPVPTPTDSPTVEPSPSLTFTSIPTDTATLEPTPTDTASPEPPSPTPSETFTPAATDTPAAETPTPEASATDTASPDTPTPTLGEMEQS
jgi:hypothetical protein